MKKLFLFVVLSVLASVNLSAGISEVEYKNNYYFVYDETGRESSRKWIHEVGQLVGYNGSFMVFYKGKMFHTYDERFNKIASQWEGQLGDFYNVSGTTIVFT